MGGGACGPICCRMAAGAQARLVSEVLCQGMGGQHARRFRLAAAPVPYVWLVSCCERQRPQRRLFCAMAVYGFALALQPAPAVAGRALPQRVQCVNLGAACTQLTVGMWQWQAHSQWTAFKCLRKPAVPEKAPHSTGWRGVLTLLPNLPPSGSCVCMYVQQGCQLLRCLLAAAQMTCHEKLCSILLLLLWLVVGACSPGRAEDVPVLCSTTVRHRQYSAGWQHVCVSLAKHIGAGMAPEVGREEVGRVCIVEGCATAGWYNLLSVIASFCSGGSCCTVCQ